jgi:hypothetical protein
MALPLAAPFSHPAGERLAATKNMRLFGYAYARICD